MPSEERLELRVPFAKLLAGLLLTVVPISIAGIYSVNQGHIALERAVERNFRAIADNTADATAQFINDRVVDVGFIASDPAIVDAVEAGNRSYGRMTEAAIAARLNGIDRQWNTPEGDKLAAAMLTTRASRMLLRHRDLDNRLLRITVTDARGAVVAASHKTLDYYQADEEYWQNIYAQGRGAISVTDVLFDEATKSHYIGIGAPVMEEGTNRFIGSVDALVDISSLFPIINRTALGGGGRIMLVKEDGTVVSAPHVDLSMKLKADEYAAVQESLGTTQGRSTGYVAADVRGQGRTLIGFADTGLKQGYPKLAWVVLVCQQASEALAPLRTTERLIAFMSVFALAMVVFVAAYFALHRRLVFTEIGEVERAPRPASPRPAGSPN